MDNNNTGQIILFQTEDGQTRLEVQLKDETVWLTIDQMAELFQRNKSTISRHIKNVFEDGKLSPEVVVAKSAITTPHGAIEGKIQTHEILLFNLDMIISVGYRVHSHRGVQFRNFIFLYYFVATEGCKIYDFIIKKSFFGEKNDFFCVCEYNVLKKILSLHS